MNLPMRPAAWAVIAVALVIVGICYANSVPNGFILDDYHVVSVNPAIRTISPFQFLKTPYWGTKSSAGIYRPFTILSFALEYPLWHQWPGGYRLTNLLLHAINGVLVFIVLRGLLPSVTAAAGASAIYLAHPVHTEPVVGLVGRSELLATLFFLIAWILFRQKRTTLSSGAFLVSLLSKENAIAFPAVMMLDIFIAEGGFRRVRQEWKRLAAVTGVAIFYLAGRLTILSALGVPRTAQYLDGSLTVGQRELTSGRAFLKYFQLLIAPVDVTGDYDFNSIPVATANDWVAWAGVFLIVVMTVFAFRMRKHQPALAFAVFFFFITILPSSNWILPTSILMSERALYFPSLGICLIAGLLWAKVPSSETRTVLGVGVMATAALLCIAHNYIWRDDLSYYRNMVRVLPNNTRGRQGYGVALIEAGRPDEAIAQFEEGLKIKRNAPLLVSLSEAFMQIDGSCSRARPLLQEASRVEPGDPFAPWLMGGCFEKEGRVSEAEAEYRRAIGHTEFADPKLLADWGRALERTGRSTEAQEAYRRAALLR